MENERGGNKVAMFCLVFRDILGTFINGMGTSPSNAGWGRLDDVFAEAVGEQSSKNVAMVICRKTMIKLF